MDDLVDALQEDVARAGTLAGADFQRALRRASRLAELEAHKQVRFLSAVRDGDIEHSVHADQLLAAGIQAVVQSSLKRAKQGAGLTQSDEVIASISGLYQSLGPQWAARGGLLAWLAALGSPNSLRAFAGLLTSDPPREESIGQAFAPLFQRRLKESAGLYPALLDGLQHLPLAAAVLDFANFLAREKLADVHPAASQTEQLMQLLGGLSQSLASLEEGSLSQGSSPTEVSRQVEQSVSLAVSLCDALGQIGNPAAIGKLNQAMELGHRRIRTEAAAALARLGDKRGQDVLIGLASEPVARLRVLAYAKELGIEDKIAAEHRTPQALAEAELTAWLSEPMQFGVPPTACELFDHRIQFWPGYDQPVECYLFRFTYAVSTGGSERSFSNIGIAGPLTHAFLADLGDFPPDDIYAAYAGWQAEHDEIREYDVSRLSRSEKLEVERLVRRLHDAGYAEIEPQFMGYFFGDKALAAAASREGTAGVAVADFQSIIFFPKRHSRRPLSARESYCIYKGRKLLRSFNRA